MVQKSLHLMFIAVDVVGQRLQRGLQRRRGVAVLWRRGVRPAGLRRARHDVPGHDGGADGLLVSPRARDQVAARADTVSVPIRLVQGLHRIWLHGGMARELGPHRQRRRHNGVLLRGSRLQPQLQLVPEWHPRLGVREVFYLHG
jgi:hypothetical protein